MVSPLRDTIHACDGDTDTFYHSEQPESGTRHSPFFTVQFDDVYRIETITVVNVHTGAHCDNDPADCTGRIDGAKVEVLSAGNLSIKKHAEVFIFCREATFLFEQTALMCIDCLQIWISIIQAMMWWKNVVSSK